MNIKELKEKCPNLFEELRESPSISIDEIKGTREKTDKEDKENLETHTTKFPSVVDHLLGCETNEEAIEIIDYFEDKDELDERLAEKMREQVRQKGIRSFGEKREKGEIEKNGLDY